ncbi:hypothetical protein AXG93_3217s1450 [Marchantia polymorpha subsp. ruderalis]|uniref:Uncharacterized protein n=1 Tax=Marchantia polymorpha subsp. ruderalis TaxID=1480154 RepID=A0A176VWD3_MARPO|nr:hypothetical protein AXG93_3217s1450 [Marchantia polymorpha subsp. ruderalis]
MGPKKEKPNSPKSPKGKKDKGKSPTPPPEEPVEEITTDAVSALPPGELPGPPPVIKPEFVYNKELTPEQLNQILQLSPNLEEAARCLAGIMQLGDIRFDARNLILLEYCLGTLMFGKNADMKLKQIHVLYDMGHMILDIIRDAERTFRNRLIAMSMKSVDKLEEPIFSAWDLQRITPYFTSTIFQHYCLYQYCFTKDHYNITRDERVWVETPMLYPLSLSKTTEELQAEEAARKAAAEKAEADAKEAAAKASQDAFALLAAEAALRAEEELKRKPLNLQEAIEMAVRDKVLEAKKALIEEYEYREKFLIDKVLQMHGDEGTTEAAAPVVPSGKEPPDAAQKPAKGKGADKKEADAEAPKSKKSSKK